MNLGSGSKTAAAGAVVAALLGCGAGALLRPDLGEAEGGPALVVSQTPAYSDTVSYETSWWAVQQDEAY